MKTNIHEKETWQIRSEILKLHKKLKDETDKEKRLSIIEDLFTLKNLIDKVPTIKIGTGIYESKYKYDLESFLKRKERNIKIQLDDINQNYDFYSELFSKINKIDISKLEKLDFPLTNINFDEMIEIINYTFDDKTSNFFIEELKNERCRTLITKTFHKDFEISKNGNFYIKNGKNKNYYVFENFGKFTYYDLFQIVNTLSYGYLGLYHDKNVKNSIFQDLLPNFNECLIGENIDSHKTQNDYLLYSIKSMHKLVNDSKKLNAFLENNWINEGKYTDYLKHSDEISTLNYFLSYLISLILYNEYKHDKTVTLSKLDYIINNANKESTFKLLEKVGITNYDLANVEHIKQHVKKLEIKCDL